jgi:hypothetical protein
MLMLLLFWLSFTLPPALRAVAVPAPPVLERAVTVIGLTIADEDLGPSVYEGKAVIVPGMLLQVSA